VDKAVQIGVDSKHVQEVDETTSPEEGKWAMLSKYDNISRNKFLLRKYVTDPDSLKVI